MLSEEDDTFDPYLHDISEAEKLKRVGTDLYRREMLEDGYQGDLNDWIRYLKSIYWKKVRPPDSSDETSDAGITDVDCD